MIKFRLTDWFVSLLGLLLLRGACDGLVEAQDNQNSGSGSDQDFTIINGQIFTPGLAIVDAPQPGTPEGGGMCLFAEFPFCPMLLFWPNGSTILLLCNRIQFACANQWP